MSAPITTKHRLFDALSKGGVLREIANQDLILHAVQAVEREDGSGQSWNVRGYIQQLPGPGKTECRVVHVRTLD